MVASWQRQNGRHFADDIFKRILLNENVWIPNKILHKFVPKGPINNIPSLVQIMAWCQPGDKPLSEPIMLGLLMHLCVTRPQWLKTCELNHMLRVLVTWSTLTHFPLIFSHWQGNQAELVLTWNSKGHIYLLDPGKNDNHFNSLANGRCGNDFKSIYFKLPEPMLT